jgi:hypothetical protein
MVRDSPAASLTPKDIVEVKEEQPMIFVTTAGKVGFALHLAQTQHQFDKEEGR